MSDENQAPEQPKFDLPKFDMPKAAPVSPRPAVSPVAPTQRPAGMGASAAAIADSEKTESPVFVALDAIAMAAAIAFAVLMFLEM